MDLMTAIEADLTSERRRFVATPPALVGGRCSRCQTPSWPRRSVCHRCHHGRVDEFVFSAFGDLITYTTVHIARPGLSAPYTLGQVRLLDNGPLVFGQIAGLPEEPRLPVRLRVAVAPAGHSEGPDYWFEPADS